LRYGVREEVMHGDENSFNTEFIPHKSFIIELNQTIEIYFPTANGEVPTTCLAIDLSLERVKATA
jgi:hypothetical protein